jgi:site-specific recombinase XerD
MPEIIVSNRSLHPSLVTAVNLWAQSKTDSVTPRFNDLVRDKCQALIGSGDNGATAGFFVVIRKMPDEISPQDVMSWQEYMKDMKLAPAGVYAKVSRLSSFFEWLMTEPYFREFIHHNPVKLARPKAPKPYQNQKAQALTDDEATILLQTVQAEAMKNNLSAKRDYALLRFYFATGKRREEIIGLHWGDIKFTPDVILIETRDKGSIYRTTEIRDTGVKKALFDYLKASDRWDELNDEPLMEDESPLWLRHDRASKRPQIVTSHGFVKMFKQYAVLANLGDIHLHQTRHTVARMVGEDSGDLTQVQTFLGHTNINTTRVYLNRVSIKRDRFSEAIAKRLLGNE